LNHDNISSGASLTTHPADPIHPSRDLKERRDTLLEIHSILRSADNLRPDEALDELVKLYSIWLDLGPATFSSAQRADPSLALSGEAFARATVLLGPLLAEQRPGTGADLFQELADVGVRAGLGQYFTPSPVADAMARYLGPVAGETWIDPFCGSGLLLGRIVAQASGSVSLFGVDRDNRVLRLAKLEGQVHHPETPSRLLQTDALSPLEQLATELESPEGGFDGVITNPPFGASIHLDDHAKYGPFTLASKKANTPLEILGLERSIQLLRPGGRVGIVLPQSILSNRGCRRVREFLLANCDVKAVLSLPPETFGPFRGVGKAATVFAFKKKSKRDRRSSTALAISRRIGWDGTGRANGDQDVVQTAEALSRPSESGDVALVFDRDALERNMTPEWHLRPDSAGVALKDLCETIFCGRTPGRASYVAAADESRPHMYRVLKVADLTGNGIDWSLGERSCAFFAKPVTSKLLELGDIALTAAAHHPRYIGAKVDIVDQLPEGFEQRVFPSAEVMILRPDPKRVNPVQLLLWLQTPDGRNGLQACVTGQTAHLYAEDVGEIVVPENVLNSDPHRAISLATHSLELRRKAESAALEAREAFKRSIAA
jgi:type I restriction enzyme M protein